MRFPPARILWIGLLVLVLSGCGGPPKTAVISFFEADDPNLQIDRASFTMQQRYFSSAGKHRYRIEFKGKATVREDVLDSMDASQWYREVPGATQTFPIGSTPKVYRRQIAAGERVSIEGDCAATHEEGAWRFSAYRLDFLDPSGKALYGRAASRIEGDYVVLGTPEFESMAKEVVARERDEP